jgi:hypothetical protein
VPQLPEYRVTTASKFGDGSTVTCALVVWATNLYQTSSLALPVLPPQDSATTSVPAPPSKVPAVGVAEAAFAILVCSIRVMAPLQKSFARGGFELVVKFKGPK